MENNHMSLALPCWLTIGGISSDVYERQTAPNLHGVRDHRRMDLLNRDFSCLAATRRSLVLRYGLRLRENLALSCDVQAKDNPAHDENTFISR